MKTHPMLALPASGDTARTAGSAAGRRLLATLLATLACMTLASAAFADQADSTADLSAALSQFNSSQKPSGNGVNALLAGKGKSTEPDFLPPDQAFRFTALADGTARIKLIWAVTDGYYLYRSRIKASSDSSDAKVGELSLPTGETKIDDYFGKMEVYHHDVVGSVAVAHTGASELTVPLKVTYQGCATAGLCYPPITKVVNIVLPPATAGGGNVPSSGTTTGSAADSPRVADNVAAAPAAASGTTGAFVSAQDHMAAVLRDGSLLAIIAFFFISGVGLSLTPCVLPMVPILSGILAGEGDKVTRWRGFSLAFTYVQGLAVTYALAGAGFVMVFKQAPQAFFQQPWIVSLFVALFVVLAFAMFGSFTLQMPSAIQTRITGLSNQQRSGTFVGCFIMGALSALVATACVAPALIAALTVISQTGQVAKGAIALYATALGMGVPLLIVGASAGSLLPKAGPWMDTVKQLFGVVFLGLAVYFLQPLVPDSLSMLLWSALAVISGFWIFSLKARSGGPAPAAVRAAGLLTLVYGIILLIGLAAGGSDPLQPLNTLRAANVGEAGLQRPAPDGQVTQGQAVHGAAGIDSGGLTFQTVKSVEELTRRVSAASASGHPVLLDFYADWCTSCKEMERYTFSDKAVQAVLANAVLLRADVTRNDDVDRELLKHLEILGPPTIAFYGADGAERRNFRVAGYMKAPDFAALAREAFSRNLNASNGPT